MAVIKGTTWDGVEYTIDTEEKENISNKAFKEALQDAGAFDCLSLVPCHISELESKDHPGYVDCVKATDAPQYYHPIDKSGFPDFNITLNKSGKLVNPNS